LTKLRSGIEPLLGADPLPSPLFLRFAIEEAAKGELRSTDRVGLVLNYVDTLRGSGIDLSSSEMLRAASIAALEVVRDVGVPREVERLHLRGALQSEDDRAPFLSEQDSEAIPPPRIITRLVESGILNEVRIGDRVQFAYDPVAEILAVRWLQMNDDLAALRERLAGTPTPIGHALMGLSSRAAAS
jgi:hypothetical protein